MGPETWGVVCSERILEPGVPCGVEARAAWTASWAGVGVFFPGVALGPSLGPLCGVWGSLLEPGWPGVPCCWRGVCCCGCCWRPSTSAATAAMFLESRLPYFSRMA